MVLIAKLLRFVGTNDTWPNISVLEIRIGNSPAIFRDGIFIGYYTAIPFGQSNECCRPDAKIEKKADYYF